MLGDNHLGMACGAGFYKLACISALLAVIVLVVVLKLVRPFERYSAKRRAESISDRPD